MGGSRRPGSKDLITPLAANQSRPPRSRWRIWDKYAHLRLALACLCSRVCDVPFAALPGACRLCICLCACVPRPGVACSDRIIWLLLVLLLLLLPHAPHLLLPTTHMLYVYHGTVVIGPAGPTSPRGAFPSV